MQPGFEGSHAGSISSLMSMIERSYQFSVFLDVSRVWGGYKLIIVVDSFASTGLQSTEEIRSIRQHRPSCPKPVLNRLNFPDVDDDDFFFSPLAVRHPETPGYIFSYCMYVLYRFSDSQFLL